MTHIRKLKPLILHPQLKSTLLTSLIPSHSYSTSQKPVIGILGGGISGLSAAYYITKQYGDKVQTVIFEEKDRVGGWIKTVEGRNGGIFEMGPRTIRPFGIRGLNTLDLVEEIGLDKEVLYVERGHDVAKNRFIYLGGGLVKLPGDYKVLYKRVRPFSRPLVFALLRDIFAKRKTLPDDSIYNFVNRRFGKEIAEYLTDPLIRGICAGDSKQISVKFLMKSLFELEQNHGSVVLGTLREKFSTKKKCKLSEQDKGIGFSKVAAASILGNWAVWGLERGIESLVVGIYEWLKGRGVEVKIGCRVDGLEVEGSGVGVRFSYGGRGDTVYCDRVVSSVGSNVLSGVLRRSGGRFEGVASQLEGIEYASLRVTGLRFKGDVLRTGGFGFLVPSCEKGVGGLLGVVFDTNCFPQGGDTVVTCMSRGGVEEAKGCVKQVLGVESEAVEVCSEQLVGCIPQYGVGHYERVGGVLKSLGGVISVCGGWVDGVSVNDCVFGGRGVAGEVGRGLDLEEDVVSARASA